MRFSAALLFFCSSGTFILRAFSLFLFGESRAAVKSDCEKYLIMQYAGAKARGWEPKPVAPKKKVRR